MLMNAFIILSFSKKASPGFWNLITGRGVDPDGLLALE
jgi:hypothetical protein